MYKYITNMVSRHHADIDTDTDTDTDTQTHRRTDTQTHRHTDTQTHRHTDTQTHMAKGGIWRSRLVCIHTHTRTPPPSLPTTHMHTHA